MLVITGRLNTVGVMKLNVVTNGAGQSHKYQHKVGR